MKVCAHIVYGPFNLGHERFKSASAALAYFRNEVAGIDYGTGLGSSDSGQTIDLYPQCDDCTDTMNFHDWPMARYTVGPRGGIRRVRT